MLLRQFVVCPSALSKRVWTQHLPHCRLCVVSDRECCLCRFTCLCLCSHLFLLLCSMETLCCTSVSSSDLCPPVLFTSSLFFPSCVSSLWLHSFRTNHPLRARGSVSAEVRERFSTVGRVGHLLTHSVTFYEWIQPPCSVTLVCSQCRLESDFTTL